MLAPTKRKNMQIRQNYGESLLSNSFTLKIRKWEVQASEMNFQGSKGQNRYRMISPF